jgi:DNA topoisomerase-3
VGQLHRDLFGERGIERRAFEHVMGGLARAGLVRIRADEFVKDGATIVFQRVHLEPAGRDAARASGALRVVSVPGSGPATGRRRTKGKGRERPRRNGASSSRASPPLVEALRAWRAREAGRRRVPAFRILTDRTLVGIADARPKDEDELLDVSGIGPALLARYGAALLSIVAREGR